MSLEEFNFLPFEAQLALVYAQGVYLAQRAGADHCLNLYHLPGDLFVEICYDPVSNAVTRAAAFTSANALDTYLEYIRLPPL